MNLLHQQLRHEEVLALKSKSVLYSTILKNVLFEIFINSFYLPII